MVQKKTVFVERKNAVPLHTGQFPGQGSTLHAQIIRHRAPIHIQRDLQGFLLLNLLGKKGDQFFADGFFGQHLDAVVEAQAALGHRAKQIDAEAGAQGIGKKGAVARGAQ